MGRRTNAGPGPAREESWVAELMVNRKEPAMYVEEHLMLDLHHRRAQELRADASAERLANSVRRGRHDRRRSWPRWARGAGSQVR
jgi:hypothetical protein